MKTLTVKDKRMLFGLVAAEVKRWEDAAEVRKKHAGEENDSYHAAKAKSLTWQELLMKLQAEITSPADKARSTRISARLART